jgi:hypothetical protein
MVLSVHLRLSAVVAIVDCTDRGQLIDSRLLNQAAPKWICFFQQSLCAPSLWEDPFGMIAAEVQMKGIAVIDSLSGGLAEITDYGNTEFILQPGNVDALARSMPKLTSNRSLVFELGHQSHIRASRLFGADAVAKRFELIYDTVIRKQSFSDADHIIIYREAA